MFKSDKQQSSSPKVFNVKFPCLSAESTPLTIINVFLREKKQQENMQNSSKDSLISRPKYSIFNEYSHKRTPAQVYKDSNIRRNSHYSSVKDLIQDNGAIHRISSYDNLKVKEPVKFYRNHRDSSLSKYNKSSYCFRKYSIGIKNSEFTNESLYKKSQIFQSILLQNKRTTHKSLENASKNIDSQLKHYRKRLNRIREYYEKELYRHKNLSAAI